MLCLGGSEGNEDSVIGGDEWCHRVSLQGESTERLGRHQQETGSGSGHGTDEWKMGRGGGCRRRRGVRVSKEQCQRQQQRLAATGIPVNHGAHTHTVSPTPFFSLSNCRSRPAPLAWMVAEVMALAPELGPLAREESPHRAVCQGLLIWAR